jgi:hypothetical protein
VALRDHPLCNVTRSAESQIFVAACAQDLVGIGLQGVIEDKPQVVAAGSNIVTHVAVLAVDLRVTRLAVGLVPSGIHAVERDPLGGVGRREQIFISSVANPAVLISRNRRVTATTLRLLRQGRFRGRLSVAVPAAHSILDVDGMREKLRHDGPGGVALWVVGIDVAKAALPRILHIMTVGTDLFLGEKVVRRRSRGRSGFMAGLAPDLLLVVNGMHRPENTATRAQGHSHATRQNEESNPSA